MLPQQYCLRWKYHHSNLQTMFSQLLDRGCFCDVTLACDGQIIRAHRVVLCACSTFFDTILTNYATDKDPIIIMKDAKYSDVKYLVDFMYKGEINVEHANLASLLKTAEELKIKGLAEVSWRDDENLDQPVPEPETKLHGYCSSQEKEFNLQQFNFLSSNNNNTNKTNTIDEINQTANNRIQRMPLLTPIPSPNQLSDQSSLKRKRGRPPLDDTYDIFSVQKMSHLKSVSSGLNNNSGIENTNNAAEQHQQVGELSDDENAHENSRKQNHKNNKNAPCTSSKRKSGEMNFEHDSEVDEKPCVEQLQQSVIAAAKIPMETENNSFNDRNDKNNQANLEISQNPNDYLEDIDEKNLLEEQNNDDDISDIQEYESCEIGESRQYILTQAELEEWKDVIKMDAYLAIGRRPQFWEEPFTKRVLEAIKTKKLEMKKAAQLLGVSYGTLYGRYREVYGCLKHPYR